MSDHILLFLHTLPFLFFCVIRSYNMSCVAESNNNVLTTETIITKNIIQIQQKTTKAFRKALFKSLPTSQTNQKAVITDVSQAFAADEL